MTDHDSSQESDEGEEKKDVIAKPKHKHLLKQQDFDKVRDFDPVRNKVDRMILDYVISEKKAKRNVVHDSLKNYFHASLNGDSRNSEDRGRDSMLNDPNERLL